MQKMPPIPLTCRERITRIRQWFYQEGYWPKDAKWPLEYSKSGILLSIHHDRGRIYLLKRDLINMESNIFSLAERNLVSLPEFDEILELHDRLFSITKVKNMEINYLNESLLKKINKLKTNQENNYQIKEIAKRIISNPCYQFYLKYHNLNECKEKEIIRNIDSIRKDIKALKGLRIKFIGADKDRKLNRHILITNKR